MQKFHQRRLPLIGLTLTAVLLILVGLASALPGPVGEIDLNKNGTAFEVFRDENGLLWISDYGAGEIWRIDPNNNEYTIYGRLSGAADAKVDGNGDLWWNDWANNNLGHLVLENLVPGQITATATIRPIRGEVSQTLGLAIDPLGNIWTSDEGAPIVHQYQPATGKMCAYAVPGGGASSYIVADSGRLWLGDWINNRILALEPVQNEFDIWQIPDANDANIYGLAADENHDIWWADQNQNYLGQLTPANNLVTTYTVPLSLFGPTAVTTNRSWIWSTGWGYGFIARLSPDITNGNPVEILPSSVPVTPSCDNTEISEDLTITIDGPHAFSWDGGFYNRVFNFDGWLIYQIESLDSSDGMPWGIAAAGPDVFIVDQGRQKLTWLRACFELELGHTGNGDDPVGSPDPSNICAAGEYLAGEQVTLTAQPAAGYGVLGWNGTNNDNWGGLINIVTMPGKKHTVSVEYGPSTFLPLILRN